MSYPAQKYNKQFGNAGHQPPPAPHNYPPPQGDYKPPSGGHSSYGTYAPPPGPPPSQGSYPPPLGPPPPRDGYAPPPYPPPQSSYVPPSYPPKQAVYAPPPYPPTQAHYPPPTNPPHKVEQTFSHTEVKYDLSYERPPLPPRNHQYQLPPGPPPNSYTQRPINGYAPQLSNCTGRKRALLIGINYFEKKICGHGGQAPDLDGDEDDGYDETIMPLDFQKNGQIIDDTMHDIMVRPLPPGVRLTAIFDSCHSGTALDLPYIYSTHGKVKEPNLLSEGSNAIMNAGMSYLRGDFGGIKTSLISLGKKATSGKSISAKNKIQKSSPADVIMLSGCKDGQTSADTNEAGVNTGAMSYALIKTLRANKNISYQQMLNSVRDVLSAKYSQKPQLSASHEMDMNLMFII
ncbi:peptidase C14 [Rhizophagus clarus]|uniref:Peptidase C14 n=1 Tax=Rhizophagus clarus TaxID=94130 RepID=A0A8H3LSW2_9GLOM|nr:peptidase C14 [Rhizophagus clarus]